MNVFRKWDAGEGFRSADAKNADCQVRALTTARRISYNDAWLILYAMQGERRACSFVLVYGLRDKDKRLGVIRQFDFPAVKGEKRMTGYEFCRKYTKGRFILRMAHHVAAVKDGQLYDTGDSSTACVYTAWEVEPATSNMRVSEGEK